MPYIQAEDREYLRGRTGAGSPGELNFQFTDVIRRYVKLHGLKYTTINDVIGALEGAKLEFYRRVAIPYENVKIKENGDVYE